MNEYHICGVLLMSRPEHSAMVEKALAEMPGVELHANEGGRMVVTVEGDAYRRCADTITELSTMDGVASSCEGDSWLLPSGECSLFGCPAGYFRSSSATACSQCDAACSECSGPSSSECLACSSSHYLNKLNGQAGDCHAKTT